MTRPPRRPLQPWEKEAVRNRQDGLCACGCERKLSEHTHQFDHIEELWEIARWSAEHGSFVYPEAELERLNRLENFQALVLRPCHQEKSAKNTGRRAKADRQRKFQESGKGRAPTRSLWRWRRFSGEVKEKRT
jgi:hypothetical protein